LIAGVAAVLAERDEPFIVTKEPGGTPFGEAVREVFLDPGFSVDPIAEVMLVNASRAQLVAEVIAPALKSGMVVLCDRFFDATVAYQGFGRGLDVEGLLEICLVATHRIAPDLTFVIDVPIEVSAERVRARGGADRLELEDGPFHARVREGYIALANRFQHRFYPLDGLREPADLVAEAVAVLDARRSVPR
jgi:dTMP kinase